MSIGFVPVSSLPAPLRTRDLLRLSRALEREIPKTKQGEISVRFVSAKEIQRLNRTYRGKDNATDVLSFHILPLTKGELEGVIPSAFWISEMGDLALCPSFAKREASRRGIAWREELLRLLAHGALHLAGLDHETEEDEARMFKKQERAVAKTIGLGTRSSVIASPTKQSPVGRQAGVRLPRRRTPRNDEKNVRVKWYARMV